MIHLHYANRLESLIAPLAESIAAQQRARPLERVTIVVPNRVIEHFLKHRVSEAIGIAANLAFPFLRRFLAEVIESVAPKIHILEVEELELVLFESLRADVRGTSPEFGVPRSYIEKGQPTEGERELRTFRLARQLARLFREYSIQRRSMLQQWQRQHARKDEKQSETERWQQHVWTSLFGANGDLRAEWKRADSECHWRLLPEAFEAVPTSGLKAALPRIVHVFGLAYVGPAYLRILSQIGELTDLKVYALNPCLEFWEDVEHLSRIDRESWARRRSKVGDDLEHSSDPFGLEAAGDTPALRLWARPGREYIRMLNELTDCGFDAHFTHRSSSTIASLLGTLQEDILTRSPERTPAEAASLDADASIRFLACPGVAREAEIVANEIWSTLENDRGPDPIRFHQIAVIVPDAQYSEYLPHLENAFSRLHQLPMNIVNRGSQSPSPVREAISLLLRLPLGRFSRDEMLHLLNHPVIRGEDEELDANQAGRWCEELGIFFGADAQDLANSYIPPDTYHWDQGIRRLALGVFLGREPDRKPRFYSGPESIEYLPCETEQDEIPAVADFIRSARALISDALDLRSARLTVEQWSRRLVDLIATHIHVNDAVDERIRQRCIEAIESLSQTGLTSAPVSYEVAHEIAFARMSELESQVAQFTESGIAIGPLSALRAIPFRAIFLIGLNEARFPERDRRDPMDLRHARRKAGDVTPTERDRYLFLETLLAARECIRLSYVARDPKTGDRLDPSSVVRELQFVLRGYIDGHMLAGLTIEHPLSRYDDAYFPEIQTESLKASPRRTSYDSEARRGAIAAALRSDLARHCGSLVLPGRDEPVYQQLEKGVRELIRPTLRLLELPRGMERSNRTEISLPLSALRKFLECPLQGTAQYALGIFEDDGDEMEQWQDEPIAQTILDRTTLMREVFWNARGHQELLATEYSSAVRLAQLAGGAPTGPFADAAQRIDHANLDRLNDQARDVGCGSLDLWHELRMGRGDESATADLIFGELLIPLGVEARIDEIQSRMAKLNGNLGFMSPSTNASLRLVLRDYPKPKDFLGGILSALALAASGKLSDPHFRAIVIGTGKHKSWNDTRKLTCPTPQAARDYLSNLASDLLLEKNHYFLPIEAVEGVIKELDQGRVDDLRDTVNDLRENEFARCSSDYGPIRDARRFQPPSDEALRRIIARRFGLIRSIFVKEKG